MTHRERLLKVARGDYAGQVVSGGLASLRGGKIDMSLITITMGPGNVGRKLL